MYSNEKFGKVQSGNFTHFRPPTPEQNEIINHIILEVKYYIYVCKLKKCDPLYYRIKNSLKITEHIENEIAFKA
jgi:hypothetical protein